MNTLYMVVPCYNEEESLESTASILKDKMRSLMSKGRIASNSRILFVDDGSKDGTLNLMKSFHEQDSLFSFISYSKNFGHQNAVLGGYFFSVDSGADVVISIDADLQQDTEAIDLFLDKYYDGAEIVYGVRNSRETDGVLKKITAGGFYDIMRLFDCNVIKNHADYRLMSAKAINTLKDFKEVNLFLRGIIPLCGYKSDIVNFDVCERKAGKSKYTMKKMINFALDGITSLSMQPIRWITALGGLVFTVALGLIVFYLIAYVMGKTVSGWTSLIVSIWALGGLQLIGIGVVGEYVGKTYMETKQRPRYIIQEFQNDEESMEE